MAPAAIKQIADATFNLILHEAAAGRSITIPKGIKFERKTLKAREYRIPGSSDATSSKPNRFSLSVTVAQATKKAFEAIPIGDAIEEEAEEEQVEEEKKPAPAPAKPKGKGKNKAASSTEIEVATNEPEPEPEPAPKSKSAKGKSSKPKSSKPKSSKSKSNPEELQTESYAEIPDDNAIHSDFSDEL